jgi:hypothetical protein
MNPYETRRIGVGVHTAAEVQISPREKTITLVLLRMEGGRAEDSCCINVPWQENESLEELGRMVLITAEKLGLVLEGKTDAHIIDVDCAARFNRG